MPAPCDQIIVSEMLVHEFETAATVSLGVLELPANLRDGFSLPSHLDRSDVPSRVPGNTAVRRARVQGIVFVGMAGLANSLSTPNRRQMRMHVICLRRAIAGWVTIYTAWIGEHFGNFREKRLRTSLLISNAGECRWSSELGRRLSRC